MREVNSITTFEQAKQAISIPQAAERYGLNTKANHMICCPFHDDHIPSMKLNDTYFYCYSCGAYGDVVDFTARLFGIRPWEAARKLLADFGIPIDMTPVPRQYPPTKAQTFQELERLCFSVLSNYHQHLLQREKQFRPEVFGQLWDKRFCDALREKDSIQYQLDVLLFGTRADREQLIQELVESGRIYALRDHVYQYEQEQTNV